MTCCNFHGTRSEEVALQLFACKHRRVYSWLAILQELLRQSAISFAFSFCDLLQLSWHQICEQVDIHLCFVCMIHQSSWKEVMMSVVLSRRHIVHQAPRSTCGFDVAGTCTSLCLINKKLYLSDHNGHWICHGFTRCVQCQNCSLFVDSILLCELYPVCCNPWDRLDWLYFLLHLFSYIALSPWSWIVCMHVSVSVIWSCMQCGNSADNQVQYS